MLSSEHIKYFYIPIFLVLVLSLTTGCTSKKFTANNMPEEMILFGSGGGVTGKTDTYLLLKNGQLFLTNSLTKETIELESFDKRIALSFFESIQSPEISEVKFNHPGNHYYFLEHKTSVKEQRMVWGATDHSVPEAVKQLYQKLVDNVKKNNP